jgi:hypothetical protein
MTTSTGQATFPAGRLVLFPPKCAMMFRPPDAGTGTSTIPGSSGYSSSQVSASSASNVWVLGTDVNGSLNRRGTSSQVLALHWTGGGTIHDVVPIPAASGSYWGAASAETSAKSSVDHPAMVVYGPVP